MVQLVMLFLEIFACHLTWMKFWDLVASLQQTKSWKKVDYHSPQLSIYICSLSCVFTDLHWCVRIWYTCDCQKPSYLRFFFRNYTLKFWFDHLQPGRTVNAFPWSGSKWYPGYQPQNDFATNIFPRPLEMCKIPWNSTICPCLLGLIDWRKRPFDWCH